MTHAITVTVEADHLDQIDKVADRLRGAGMRVDQILRPVGIITGSIGDSERDSLGGLPGVAAVEGETTVQLPPPEAGVQ
jgi:hypothetical protein